MEIFVAGDLHLHTKEIRSTKKMVDNNEVMLDGLYDTVSEQESIRLMLYAGDIQHATPSGKNTLFQTTMWENKFREMGVLMQERFDPKEVKVIMHTKEETREINQKLRRKEIYPLFSLKGNHDIDNTEDFTFFDMLVEKGLLINPKALMVGTTQINFYNYGEAGEVRKRYKGAEKVVGFYHDIIATEESPFWVGKHPAYQDSEVLVGEDLAIIGHIHTESEPIIVDTVDGGKCVVWYIGSMGRTSYATGQIRSYGHSGVFNTEDLSKLGRVTIPLIPKEEYFNMSKEMAVRGIKKTYSDFRLGLEEDVVRQYTDPRDDIRGLKDIPEDVMRVCVEILDEVMEG